MKNKTISFSLLILFFICLNNLSHVNKYAYAVAKTDSSNLPSIIYYDADDRIEANKNTGNLALEGNASLLLGNLYITARKIIVLKSEDILTAEGNVKFIYNKQKGIASKIIVDLATKQIRMDNAQIFSDPSIIDDSVSKEVLGLSKAEVVFDQDKTTRAKEIRIQLKLIRNEYTNLRNLLEIKRNDQKIQEKINILLVRYSQLLARYSRTQYQPNAYLAAIPEREKERFLKRREAVEKFNKENPDIVNQIANFNPIPGYVSVSASQIIQKDNQTFILNNAIITPCHCSSYGEPPIFGFSTQKAKIDVGNYITMQGSTFDILSFPLLYSPWFKLSIKNKRETGFLYPGGYATNNAGQSISVPFFLVLGDHADSTLTYQNFSSRGSQFSSEFRAQINEEAPGPNQLSQLYSQFQVIQDKQYNSDLLSNNAKIDSTSNPSSYENYRGKTLTNRWYTENSINIPISYWSSFKLNGQFVSDNTYLADFSASTLVDPTAVVSGDTTSASRRFLAQEVDTEYYGSNSILSIRAQGQQDLFTQNPGNTPIRLPRLEYTLLPKRYFNSPFVFSNDTTFENVLRTMVGGNNYLVNNYFIKDIQPRKLIPGVKDSIDPYVEGKRLYTSSTLSLPLAANDYVNASVSVTATGTQYYFPAANPYGPIKPYLGYMQYSANLDAPIFSRLNIKGDENESGSITQNTVPYVKFNYIPNIIRSLDFPKTFQAWYAQDGLNLATSASLTLGINTSWTVKKQKYAKSSDGVINRFLQTKEPPVGNLQYFTDVIQAKQLNIANKPDAIFQFSSEIDANKVFESWAKKELENYYNEALIEDVNQRYTWPENNYYALASDLEITPISISISTSYNFMADKTANELNENLGDYNPAPYPVTTYGNINGSLNWNLFPLFVLDGSIAVDYSQVYKRLVGVTSSFNTTLPYNIGLNYTHALQYVVSTSTSSTFIEKTQDSVGVSYNPLVWLLFGFKWSYSTDPSATPPDTSNGKNYVSVYYVNIANVQDCLDIVIERSKPPGIPENQATYLIGVNLKLFGRPLGKKYVGDYLNRRLQN